MFTIEDLPTDTRSHHQYDCMAGIFSLETKDEWFVCSGKETGGSLVQELPGLSNTLLEDLKFLNNKLTTCLRVPASYMTMND